MNLFVQEEGTSHCKLVSFTNVTKSFYVVIHGSHSMFPQSAFTVEVLTANSRIDVTSDVTMSCFGIFSTVA